MTDDILFEEIGDWGVVTLNRPQALNALTLEMVIAMRRKLADWKSDSSPVRAVMVKSEGDRAFCAGGDIRWLRDTAKDDPKRASVFFREEYQNNAQIFHYPKPYLSIIDGIVMGGGVGISVHGDYRVISDATMFAMPETGIGLFPDVGGGHFLPRLADGLGFYYGLTGARAKADDCMAAGIGTHYVKPDVRSTLTSDLLRARLKDDPHGAIKAVLNRHGGDPGKAPIDDDRDQISRLFKNQETLEALLQALEMDESAFAQNTLTVLRNMSPTSLKLTFEQLNRGRSLDFEETMKMEFRIVCRVLNGHDFYEGVRAQVVDKDRNPKWVPASIEAVEDASIARYFESLGDDELTFNEAI